MRKHFLLLFLMAILPLAGWADDPVPAAPDAKTNLVYDATAQELVTAVAEADHTYYFAVVAKDAAKPEFDAYGTSIPKGTAAGGYDVYYVDRLTADGAPAVAADVAGATKITVTIAKKLATVTINAAATC